jgi:aryl-alcohol dehydrogenase-like predicted oxidoreductase/predicted kinase
LELRIGLGCMRLSTDEQRDEKVALATVGAAAEAGVTVFDTAHAYGPAGEPGHNERLLARALRAAGAHGTARVVTKGGMKRLGGAWTPDGRAKAIRADCEASLAALDGLPIDLYLLHAPDPRTPWRTSLRALAGLAAERLVGSVGVANVDRRQLDEALDLAPVAAVQVALSVLDDRAVRGGLVERCGQEGIALIAHSPLGGPRRAAGLARRPELAEVASALGATPAEVALAWLLGLAPTLVAVPGARRPESARSAARAGRLRLDRGNLAALARAFGDGPASPAAPPRPARGAEVVLVMGIPGAGKSRVAARYAARGYTRLNRDERGGTLRGLAGALERELEAGARRVVLDNTYLTRASRSYVIDAARRHGVAARCVWLETPLNEAQVNLVERLLDRFGALPTPEELRAHARREAGLLTPTAQMRALRELEPPTRDEGLASIERRPFARDRDTRPAGAGVFVAAAVLREPAWSRLAAAADPGAPHLVFDWRPGAGPQELDPLVEQLAAEVIGPVDAALCPHPGGPPACWCRPPLPGLPLAFARARSVDPGRSILVGVGPAHRTLAATLGARYLDARRAT